ncbi:alpha/beta hydrolase [Sulfurimonas sp. HSL3-7]|uniref:alpha/beta fold hydrolase n=1 Tax=Sulfonitrofixus jiaomeiensis TaxID=3131938 RepID=UPI0031F799EC
MGLYKNQAAKEAAYASYDRVMTLWPVPYEEIWVETEYGKTHVVISGAEGKKPLYLLPGLFADATMWYANAGELAKHCRIYCLDHITYGGKSEPSGKKVAQVEDYAAWFEQIMRHLGHRQTAVAGLSYGGWLALALAREMPKRIAAVIMLDPSESFIKMDGGIVWKGFWNFVFFPNRRKYRRFFDWMGGGFRTPASDIWLEHMVDVIEHGSVGMFDIPQHRIFRRNELETVRMPLLIMAGGKPILYKDPSAFAAAAAEALPHAKIEIVPQTGHGLHMEKAGLVNRKMVDFLTKNYL